MESISVKNFSKLKNYEDTSILSGNSEAMFLKAVNREMKLANFFLKIVPVLRTYSSNRVALYERKFCQFTEDYY